MLAASAPSGGDDYTVGTDDKQFGKIFGLTQFAYQRSVVDMWIIPTEAFRHLCQVLPLLARPTGQQGHSRLGDGLKGLFDHRVGWPIEPTRPPHRNFSRFAKPGQPVFFVSGQTHRVTG
ncbi:hypothetical protein D3C71_667220 [compost metagenome]